jgi:hypothetical protein
METRFINHTQHKVAVLIQYNLEKCKIQSPYASPRPKPQNPRIPEYEAQVLPSPNLSFNEDIYMAVTLPCPLSSFALPLTPISL